MTSECTACEVQWQGPAAPCWSCGSGRHVRLVAGAVVHPCALDTEARPEDGQEVSDHGVVRMVR